MKASTPSGAPADGSHVGYRVTLLEGSHATGGSAASSAASVSSTVTRALVMHETRLAPVYYFPRDDVRMDLMEMWLPIP